MSQFIHPEDYDASVHQEILNAITRGDKTIIEMCEERALSQMRGYLAGRYDCDALFRAQGEDRHPLILMYAVDISLYHLFSVHNPQKMTTIRKDRYDEAIQYLDGVARGRLSFEGAPLAHPEEAKLHAPMRVISNRKRNNRL